MYVKQLPSGTWRVIVQVNGRRASGTAPTQSEAKMLGARLMLDAGGTPKMAGMTVGELADLHLLENGYKPTTHADLTRIRERLPATFMARDITTVTPVIVDALYRQLTADGWTPHRVRRAHELLGPAFKRAKRRGWVPTIPTRDAETPRTYDREDTTPELEDVRVLLAAAEPTFRTFLWLALTTGARRGELCALKWEDIDVRKQLLRIRRSVSYTPASGLVEGDVKTGSKGRRDFPIDEVTLAELDLHRTAQRVTQLPSGMVSPWIFTMDYVKPWRPDYATHQFIELRDAVGLPHVRLHDLRHLVASELVGGITDPRTASELLGHARTSMTLDRYAASTNTRRRDAAAALQRRLRG